MRSGIGIDGVVALRVDSVARGVPIVRMVIAWVLLGLGVSAPALGAINVELRAERSAVEVGDTVRVGVYVQSDTSEDQLLSAAQVILEWDPVFLRLSGLSPQGAVSLLASTFPSPDPFGLNERNPPTDGLGLYVAFAPLGNPVPATPAGSLLTTLLFEALRATPGSAVGIVAEAGMPAGRTTVFDGRAPNLDVTGSLGEPVVIAIPPPACGVVLAVGLWAGHGGRRRRA